MNSQRIERRPAQQQGAAAAVTQDSSGLVNSRVVETSIPARLDHLRWSRFHTRVVLALGLTWILDGLEVTLTVFAGYLLGSVLMIAAAAVAWRYCVASERRPLESVAKPLAFVE